ncbi:MAG TPA: hypothetical protein VFE34_23910 [Dongiaceae bacterium]|jgi:hypothetical protein|nr:hypothetical protein [Dongiaceae bacterium]
MNAGNLETHHSQSSRLWSALALLSILPLLFVGQTSRADDPLPNACPVDGCAVQIVAVQKEGDELRLTLKANFTPDFSRNHVHVWWGDNFTIEQVSNNAEPVHHVKQGEWHPTDEYPGYVTQSAASTEVRGKSKTLCVSAADRNHDILDITKFQCMDVSGYL